MTSPIHVVTGAFGYSGQYIARRLLDRGYTVRTLTNSPDRKNRFEGKVQAERFHFDYPDRLAESLTGANVLYNTYWVRFNHADFQQQVAVENTRKLFDAARRAGVRRIVHVSITNPSENSPLEYFAGKARLERALRETGLSFAILRPTVLFGKQDVLVNNIAWLLRRLPVFGIFGTGEYRLQPIYVDDLARLAVEQGASDRDGVIDAIGPETFTYRELVQRIGQIIGKRRPVVSVPAWLGHAVGAVLGKIVGDVIITREEIEGLMADLLYVDSPPAGETKLTEWATAHADTLGRRYASELARRRNRAEAYESL
jgi:uncharacterized protein YbjT (DUF2867 family)